MRNLARKIIDATQHSMLDKLVVRLFTVACLLPLFGQSDLRFEATLIWVVLPALIVGFAAIWFIGFIATPRRRPEEESGWLSSPTLPGMERWEEPLYEGLRPPLFMRAVVTVLGYRKQGWVNDVMALLYLGSILLLFASAEGSQRFWANIHPALATEHSRETLFWIALSMATALTVERWARDQHQRLYPTPTPPRRPASPVRDSVTLTIVIALALAVVALSFDLPIWWAPAGAALIVVVSRIPPWRAWGAWSADKVFGPRTDDQP